MSRAFHFLLCCLAAVACLAGCARPAISSPLYLDLQGARLALFQEGGFPAGEEGRFGPGREKNAYVLGKPRTIPGGLSLELEFHRGNKATAETRPELGLALSSRADSGKPFLEERLRLQTDHLFYVLALPEGQTLARIDISLVPDGGSAAEGSACELVGMREVPAWKGFERLGDGIRISPGVSVYRKDGLEHVEIPAPGLPQVGERMAEGGKEASEAGIFLSYRPRPDIADMSGSRVSFVDGAGGKFQLRARPRGTRTFIPAGIASLEASGSLDVAFPRGTECLALASGLFSGRDAELADFGRILRSAPRGTNYELYSWDLIPSTLIFDFRDYATQDAYLKRLAFFVEKIGFRGRLASDAELAGLHGWNAHDYRAEDLAAFFDAAAGKGFPLNPQERELEAILVGRGMIVEKAGRIEAGEGAIVSIARESVPYLRTLFLTHESTHAIFFTDAEYRDFVRGEWSSMGKEEKWFWKLFFGWKTYNTDDDYLMANEYQAYLLQQTLLQTRDYFTKNAPAQLTEKHPELVQQLETYMVKYGDSFEKRAVALDAWLGAKYGFRAGRGSTY
jgi:hypothetical protein